MSCIIKTYGMWIESSACDKAYQAWRVQQKIREDTFRAFLKTQEAEQSFALFTRNAMKAGNV